MLDHYYFPGILESQTRVGGAGWIISFGNAFSYLSCCPLLAGNTFLSHPDNVSPSTKRCLKLPGILGMTVKSASLPQNMFLWSEWALSGGLLTWGLVLGCLCADGAGHNSPD